MPKIYNKTFPRDVTQNYEFHPSERFPAPLNVKIEDKLVSSLFVFFYVGTSVLRMNTICSWNFVIVNKTLAESVSVLKLTSNMKVE